MTIVTLAAAATARSVPYGWLLRGAIARSLKANFSAQSGWTVDEDVVAKWLTTNPVPDGLPVSSSITEIKTFLSSLISRKDFINRFTLAQQQAGADNPTTRFLWMRLLNYNEIYLEDPVVIAGVAMFKTAGIITSDEAAVILAH